MTSDCVEGLTCFDMTCMNIPEAAFGDACTENADCGNINGEHTLGECRNSVCSKLPAAVESDACTYGFECDEGLECRLG